MSDETTVVAPVAGQPLVTHTGGDHHRGHNKEWERTILTEANANYRAANQVAVEGLMSSKDNRFEYQRELSRLQAEMAAFKDDLKDQIKAEAQKTRELISDNEKQRLRDKLERAEKQLTAFYISGKAPTSPIL